MTPAQPNESFLDADSPIKSREDDVYGFGPKVDGVVQQILSIDQSEGFVIGLTAPWGAGKTSMINLIEDQIKSESSKKTDCKEVQVMRFSPWLIGNYETLIASFLPMIADSLKSKIGPNKDSDKVLRYAKLATSTLIGASKIIEKLTMFKIPALEEFLEFLRQILNEPNGESNKKSINDIRQEAVKVLRKHKIPVVVVIDDLDRMEPQEIIEILRLVKSTAQLPYVTYILVYDEAKVEEAIKKKLKINGKGYLEKIVQLPINVPDISPYVLAEQIEQSISAKLAKTGYKLVVDRNIENDLWGNVIRYLILSGLLKTPRDTSRITNRFVHRWLLLNGDVEPSDLLLIAIFSLKCPKVHEWIKNYLWIYHRNVVFVNKQSAIAEYQKSLKEAASHDGVEFDRLAVLFDGIIPGVKFLFKNGVGREQQKENNHWKKSTDNDDLTIDCFAKTEIEEKNKSILSKRLASEEHWTLYFDHYDREVVWTRIRLKEFIEAAIRYPGRAKREIETASVAPVLSGGNLAERLIRVLTAEAEGGNLNQKERFAILDVVGDVADKVEQNVQPSDKLLFDMNWLFYLLCDRLLMQESSMSREHKIVEIIKKGKAESWIMYFVGVILEARKLIEGAKEDGTTVWLPKAAKESVRKTTLKKIKNNLLYANETDNLNYSIFHLETWRKLCDDNEKLDLDKWVNTEITSDTGLLRIVGKFVKYELTDTGIRKTVDLGKLKIFADPVVCKDRLRQLAQKGTMQRQANMLLEVLSNSKSKSY